MLELIEGDPIIALTQEQLHSIIDARNFTGRTYQQVEEFLSELKR